MFTCLQLHILHVIDHKDHMHMFLAEALIKLVTLKMCTKSEEKKNSVYFVFST